MKLFEVVGFLWLAVVGLAYGFDELNLTGVGYVNDEAVPTPLMVPLTLIQSAGEKGAVCLDGTLPAYHIDRGSGSGENSWIVNLEGGGWCNDMASCLDRMKTRLGSSNYMDKETPFKGILSNKPEENPDFYNWNRARIRYCDGASFLGEGYDKDKSIFFRGQRIFTAAMEELMPIGMQNANQALLAGCSAGGLASIQHCDEFRALFPTSTKVKCFADAGLFLDAVDISGGHFLRSFFGSTVSLQGVADNLSKKCTSQMDPTFCFFPQYNLGHIQTPLFLLNTAYDVWQVHQSLAPNQLDPKHYWKECKDDNSKCDADQIKFLQGFRDEMLNSVKEFSNSKQNGLFINSCFAHCQSESPDTWYGDDSPQIGNKGIAKSVGDWYFDRSEEKAIDCPYPCDKTCRNVVSNTSSVSQFIIP